jgi:hypothetical protein
VSHWAELDDNNIVLRVLVGDDNDPNGDEGYQWLIDNLGGRWIKTSYNTRNGIYYKPNSNEPAEDQSKAFRKNYAGVGYIYDEIRDAFIPPQPYEYMILNEDTCDWELPPEEIN